jgi:hypothetical protein
MSCLKLLAVGTNEIFNVFIKLKNLIESDIPLLADFF